MIRELIDTDLEVVAGGTIAVGSFNPTTVIQAFTGTQSQILNNSLSQTAVGIGGSAVNAAGPMVNSGNQTQVF
jgi:hypothetical protein